MSEITRESTAAAPTSLKGILTAMIDTGGFEAAVLTSTEGLPIVTIPPNYDSDVAAAMVALLQRVSSDAQSELGMAEVDEVTIRDHEITRLVCRYVDAGGERLILAAVVPPHHAYRRVTNRAVRQICRALA